MITVDVRAVTVGVNDSRCAVTQGADRANYREAVIPAAHVDDGRLAQVAHSRMIAALLRVHEPIFATRTDVDVDALFCRDGGSVEEVNESGCDTESVEEKKFVIGRPNGQGRRFALVRLPDGLALSAGSWNDVWAACPEFNVPWRNVEFEDDTVRDEVLKSWGTHPDMPVG